MDQQNQNTLKESKSPTKLDALSKNIQHLTKQIQKRQLARKQKKVKKKEELNDLYDAIQQKSNVVVSKIQDLTRKPTIIVSISKILPEIPEGFPKNYHIQITYEDVTVTGNQKFIDFDQNLVDERFILPLLSTENAKMEIWVAEDEPSIYDRSILNLEADIEAALQDPSYSNQINLQNNPSMSISYKVQLQGIGFHAWLKNIRTLRQSQQQRKKIKKQNQIKQAKTRQKVQQKKLRFESKFSEKQAPISKTQQYNLKGIDEIINILDD